MLKLTLFVSIPQARENKVRARHKPSKRIFFGFKRIFWRNGINVYIYNLVRLNRKFGLKLKTEKFTGCLRI